MGKLRGIVALVVGAVLVLSGTAPAGSAPGVRDLGDRSLERVRVARAAAADVVPGEVLVRYRGDVSRAERAAARAGVGARLKRRMRAGDWEVVRVAAGQEIGEAVAALERNGDVVDAVPNYRARLLTTPDDTYFGLQWGLRNTGQSGGASGADIDAVRAWSTTTGSASAVVAVVDTGVAYNHPDLASNMWTNTGESGGGKETNGLDDDGNGYVDDWRGYDWVDGDEDPYDEHGHGTHVAGIVGAAGNDGYGVSGIAWDVSIMPLRVLDENGSGTLEDIADAFAYAADNGAKVVNASLGAGGGAEVLAPVVADASGTLFVAAAGNEAANNDYMPVYPCNLTASNVVCVAATTRTDARASYSNYGKRSVDLAAPGSAVASAWLPSAAAVSGSYSLADSSAGYADSTDAWAQTVSPIDLTAQTNCSLDYALRLDTDAGDRLDVERSVDGVAWASIESGGWTGSTGGDFQSFSANLDADGEPSVSIRFRLESDASGTDDGAFVDDVAVVCGSGTVFSEDFETDMAGRWTTGGANDQWARSTVAGEWAYLDGTSMAAPHVAGAAALVQAVRSSSAGRLRNVLLGSVDRLSSLSSAVATGGRLNAYTAVRCAPDVTAPGGQKVTGSALSVPFQTAKSFAVGWTASDGSGCGLHSYDVRYKRASFASGFTDPGTWKSQVRSRSGTFTGSPGRTYCFGTRARDKALNTAAWSLYRCTAIPVNNSSLSHSDGWRKKTGASGYYLSSYSLTKERGAKLKVRDVRFTKLALVATRCGGCGTVKVYRGSTLLKKVSLNSSSYRKRQVIPIKYYSSLARESTITIKVVSSGKPVRIEGLALSRV